LLSLRAGYILTRISVIELDRNKRSGVTEEKKRLGGLQQVWYLCTQRCVLFVCISEQQVTSGMLLVVCLHFLWEVDGSCLIMGAH
jgi:hypothetical protein